MINLPDKSIRLYNAGYAIGRQTIDEILEEALLNKSQLDISLDVTDIVIANHLQPLSSLLTNAEEQRADFVEEHNHSGKDYSSSISDEDEAIESNVDDNLIFEVDRLRLDSSVRERRFWSSIQAIDSAAQDRFVSESTALKTRREQNRRRLEQLEVSLKRDGQRDMDITQRTSATRASLCLAIEQLGFLASRLQAVDDRSGMQQLLAQQSLLMAQIKEGNPQTLSNKCCAIEARKQVHLAIERVETAEARRGESLLTKAAEEKTLENEALKLASDEQVHLHNARDATQRAIEQSLSADRINATSKVGPVDRRLSSVSVISTVNIQTDQPRLDNTTVPAEAQLRSENSPDVKQCSIVTTGVVTPATIQTTTKETQGGSEVVVSSKTVDPNLAKWLLKLKPALTQKDYYESQSATEDTKQININIKRFLSTKVAMIGHTSGRHIYEKIINPLFEFFSLKSVPLDQLGATFQLPKSGLEFAKYVFSVKLLDQAMELLSNSFKPALPMASVALCLFKYFNSYVPVVKALFFRECPILMGRLNPIYLVEDRKESADALKRLSGVTRLWVALHVMVLPVGFQRPKRQDSTSASADFTEDQLWIMTVSLMNDAVGLAATGQRLPGSLAEVFRAVVQLAGLRLHVCYGLQYFKLINALFEICKRAETDSPAFVRLLTCLKPISEALKSGQMPPSEVLFDESFWRS